MICRVRSIALVLLTLWLFSAVPSIYAQEPDPEVPFCRRSGSMRTTCSLPWVERAQHQRTSLALGGRRIVTFYGSPLGPSLGILGNSAPETMLGQLRAQASAYEALDPQTEVIVAFHMVSTIADAYPGTDGDYNHRLSHKVIREWIDWAAEEHAWVIIDIQPGRSDPLKEFDLIKFFLYEPHVQLAVDPEFIMHEEGIPGLHLGKIDGDTINRIQAQLDTIAQSIGMTKVLIVHQFDNRMIVNKDMIENYWRVEVVWNADGFGSPGAKIADYEQYREEPGFEKGGIKLFYNYDTPLMTPQQVMALSPRPSIIIYQ